MAKFVGTDAGPAGAPQPPLVELAVGPRLRPLGGLQVNRAWPTARRRSIGPFVFFDHLLPAALPPGVGLDVPPHPHIGLATVTYLFEGEFMHRDSLGHVQTIRPGELNWMTAGRGIVHSERTGDVERARSGSIHGIQAWVALPTDLETCEPRFEHYAAPALPVVDLSGARLRLIAGRAFGVESPAATASPLFYAEAVLDSDACMTLPADLGERAVYTVHGQVVIGGQAREPAQMLVIRDAFDAEIRALEPTRLMLLGGAPLAGERHIWWNFVSSSPARIEEAKRDWRDGRFARVPGDHERMSAPE